MCPTNGPKRDKWIRYKDQYVLWLPPQYHLKGVVNHEEAIFPNTSEGRDAAARYFSKVPNTDSDQVVDLSIDLHKKNPVIYLNNKR